MFSGACKGEHCGKSTTSKPGELGHTQGRLGGLNLTWKFENEMADITKSDAW